MVALIGLKTKLFNCASGRLQMAIQLLPFQPGQKLYLKAGGTTLEPLSPSRLGSDDHEPMEAEG